VISLVDKKSTGTAELQAFWQAAFVNAKNLVELPHLVQCKYKLATRQVKHKYKDLQNFFALEVSECRLKSTIQEQKSCSMHVKPCPVPLHCFVQP
jgi:hypothetical protein